MNPYVLPHISVILTISSNPYVVSPYPNHRYAMPFIRGTPENSLAIPHHSLVLFHSLLLLHSSSPLLHNCLAFLNSKHLAYSHLLIIDRVNSSLHLVIVIHTSPY